MLILNLTRKAMDVTNGPFKRSEYVRPTLSNVFGVTCYKCWMGLVQIWVMLIWPNNVGFVSSRLYGLTSSGSFEMRVSGRCFAYEYVDTGKC